jgi:hypothetical protein
MLVYSTYKNSNSSIKRFDVFQKTHGVNIVAVNIEKVNSKNDNTIL